MSKQDDTPIELSSFYRYQRERGFKSIVAYIPEDLHTRFKEYVRGQGLTMVGVISRMIEQYFETKKNLK